MANYYATTRTNYFRVKDEEKFRDVINRAETSEDAIEIWEQTDDDGSKLFGFGLFGSILGYPTDEECEYAYDLEKFATDLSECIANDDAILIFESGHEKLRYVTGIATVITRTSIEYLDIRNLALTSVRELLKRPEWTTRCDY